MLTEDKVTEIFCMADDFCKFFDAMTAKYTLKPIGKRKYSSLYILLFIVVEVWRLCATFVVLFILTVPDLEYYALSLHHLLLDYPINLYIYNLQHIL